MKKDPAVLFYIDNWLVSTAEMDADCRGWYLSLLLHNYDKESLPNDIEKLASLCNVRFSEFKRFEQVFEQVLKHKFEQIDENRITNVQTNSVLEKRKAFKNERSFAGKKSYLIRYFYKNYPKEAKNNKIFTFFDENISLYLSNNEIDLKDENKIKHLFKHLFELYINRDGNKDINKDIIKDDKTNFSLLLSFLEKTVNSLPKEKTRDSRIFHNSVFYELKNNGYNCEYEYVFKNGRIDILVILPENEYVAIELDNRTPRAKNLMKIEGFDCKIVSILRDPYLENSYSQFNVDGLILYKGTEKTWRDDFDIYLNELLTEYNLLINDNEWIAKNEKLNPGLDILLTLEKACTNFWGLEDGWKNKKGKRIKIIDWKKTLTNSLSQQMNKVYKQKTYQNGNLQQQTNGKLSNRSIHAISQSIRLGKETEFTGTGL